MRYVLTSQVLSVTQVEQEAQKVGATEINVIPRFGQVYCSLQPNQVSRLPKAIKVRDVGVVRSSQQIVVEEPLTIQLASAPPAEALNMYNVFEQLRQSFQPPLTGQGLTVAVLDSGVRKTHETLENAVIYEANFSSSSTPSDVFGHGIGIAFLIAGLFSLYSGVAPGARIMNIKVLEDNGEGTEEALVLGIDHVCGLVAGAKARGLLPSDEDYPNTLNLSIGAPDDGDDNNAVRVACRTAWRDYGLQVIAAVGNDGPKPSTVEMPACDPDVIGVGGIESNNFIVASFSSRGPTREGAIKPDIVCWSSSILVASHRGNSEYDMKSGTSFATPVLAGVDGLMWELGRRVYGQSWRATWHDVLAYAPYYCVKPQNAPVDKDNDYGYGLPAINVMVNQVMGAGPATGVSTVVEAAAPLMMLVVLGTMLKGGLGA